MLSFSKKDKTKFKSFGYSSNELYPDRTNLNYVGSSYFNDGKENHSFLKSRKY
ncbi:hypothetical protein [Clostridium septicum]|uniref:Uncharacterized protein n=1 Tax=Clostridium septicum TaxID=1504 RepID=A0ABY5B020_CLOSE|nr:hypothetical protein [Clostridium septicum]MDU1314553.1 hypothetical protein [Clostridium septicum]UEC21355.1 hypothetical protein LK444_02985 [Clostridium septicum]USS00600.1 hypothetical protein NH397_14115 [Clostridium septicum]WLF69146.1 hypothetical protein Q6375_14385 [Clostridium septicum]